MSVYKFYDLKLSVNNIIMLTTEDYFTNCTNCDKQIQAYYIDLRFGLRGRVCSDCLVEANHGSFPKGKSTHVPCRVCQKPTINWYAVDTYGKRVQTDCGSHKRRCSSYFSEYDTDSDSSDGYTGFDLF
jgi:hypothetical protein